VTKTFYLGVEVLYSQLNSATTGTGSVISPAGFATTAFGGGIVNRTPPTGWSAFALTATSCPDHLIEV
jgi:hypothetical protein